MIKAIHILLGAAGLLAITLIYFILARPGQSTLSLLQWILLGGFALILGLALFLPSLLRWRRGVPQVPVSASDLRFVLSVAAVLCPLAFSAVWVFGPLGSLVIMLAPIACMMRSPRRGQSITSERPAERTG